MSPAQSEATAAEMESGESWSTWIAPLTANTVKTSFSGSIPWVAGPANWPPGVTHSVFPAASNRNSATFAAYLPFEMLWVTRLPERGAARKELGLMGQQELSEKSRETKSRRHGYRGYGSPLWEDGHGGVRRWGRWSGGALLPEAGLSPTTRSERTSGDSKCLD
jgi:hypothetical protein